MKKIFIGTFIMAAGLLASCGGSDSPQATVSEAQAVAVPTGTVYEVDTSFSVISWRATHAGGLAPRWGTLRLKEGSVSITDSANVSGGSFNINMNTLTVDSTSVTEPGKNYMDLQNHLKSNDFFGIEKYGSSTFEITTVAPYDSAQARALLNGATNMVSGNLKLKDSIINVTFPAKIAITDSVVTVDAKFSFDRSKWGLNYKAEGDPQNWMISKDIELEIRLRGKKK